jgi:Pentapeptide repeats (8 copies)
MTIRDPKARADVEDSFRKTITQLFGGIVVLFAGAATLIGAGLAYYGTQQNLRVGADQARRSEQAARDLLISNQVSKGFEQLGSDKVVVRLGGIYALEGVMNTSEQYHQPVLEALSAFVRDDTKTEAGDGPPATDIQAALTVIGRRAAIGTGVPDLTGAHIPGADLRYANLCSARLHYADLRNADLSHANLSFAFLRFASLSY